LALELMQVAIGFQECVLHYILSILTILRDVLRDAKNIPIVALDQFFERSDVAAFGCLNQRQLITDGLTYVWLDGIHSVSDATILRSVVEAALLFYLVTCPHA
jgi:hypothetical protein